MRNKISKKLKPAVVAVIALAIGVLEAGSAMALTTQEIANKLARVPVYTMGILQGEQVTFLQESIAQENGEAVRISRVYLNAADAANDLNDLKANNAELPGNVEVAQVSLGEVFCISQQNQSEPCTNTPPSTEVPPAFIYFPDRQQLTQAVSRLQEQGIELGDNTPLFVPLFLAQFQVPGQEPRTVPAIYFSVDNLEADIAAAKTEQPQLANVDISIQVTTLARVIQQLKDQDDPDLTRVEFVPLRSGTGSNSAAPNGSAPGPRPAN